MNYEKAYKEALERARKFYKDAITLQLEQDIKDYETIFPELAESEDERIRKALLEYFGEECDTATINGIYCYKIYDWLEKQGEQKPIDKAEPNFKVGDWVINRTDATIMQIVNNIDFYESVEIGGQRRTDTYNYVEWDFRLWTIQDAKDGDVIVCPKYAGNIIPNIFIFKNIKTKDNDVYCHCSFSKAFRTEGYIANAETINTDFYPATKEQRNTLMKAMADAGYTFDFEKKELKKIEQKDSTYEISGNLRGISPNFKWTEEDEKCIDNCCLLIGAAEDCYEKTFKDDCIHYLQSLKQRML